MGLRGDLGRGPVGLDTAIFIYFIEEHPQYVQLAAQIFGDVDDRRIDAVTSSITLLETLVVPYRTGDSSLANRYEALLTRSRGLTLLELDRGQLRAAAHLRALYRLRTPDALQLSAAISARCTAFVTNDRRLPAVRGMQILQLRDYLV